MTINPKAALRLQFLMRVVRKECRLLLATDQRLFGAPFTAERARQLEADPDLAERVEAFVGRFGRLQYGRRQAAARASDGAGRNACCGYR